jgi:hypothetical protein
MAKTIFPAQSSKMPQKQRTALIDKGQRMSNWLYNIAQENAIPEQYREEAKRLYRMWDDVQSGKY